MRPIAVMAFAAGIAMSTDAMGGSVQGVAPTVKPGTLSEVSNAAAIETRIWLPRLDEGFVPQGLTVIGDRVLVAAYKSTSPRLSRGESRIFSVNMKSGKLVGEFRLPDEVGHPGGLANDRRGTLFVADRGKLLMIDLERAFADGHADAATRGRADIDRDIGPSFLTWHDGHLWFGPYERYGEPRLYRFAVTDIFPPGANVYLTADDADHSIPIDVRTQGAAFDKGGFLWLSQSSGSGGVVQRLDPTSGDLLDLFELMAGVEDLSFDARGQLWTASEAGSLRWRAWDTYYPLIFSVDTARLR